MHFALGKGAIAVVTGGASGIGLAAMRHWLRRWAINIAPMNLRMYKGWQQVHGANERELARRPRSRRVPIGLTLPG